MQWANTKFWCYAIVTFPLTDLLEAANEDPFLPQWNTVEPLFGDPPQQSDCPGTGPTENEVEDVCFELLSFASEFELNSIPQANIAVALGRVANDLGFASRIHEYVDKFQLQLPVTVWCQAKSNAGSNLPVSSVIWPAGAFKVFEGRVTGSSFRNSGAAAEFVLSLTHWLSDLNFSSALSKQGSPLNPAQFYYPSNYTAGANFAAGGAVGPMMVAVQKAILFFPTTTILQDFWGGTGNPTQLSSGLKDWLTYLTKDDRINFNQINTLPGAGSPLKPEINWEACRALKRFEPNALVPGKAQESGYILGKPLAMSVDAPTVDIVARAIGEDIGFESIESYTNVTLWDKLAGELHANYMYSVVPLIEKALVVPFTPGLSSGNSNAFVHRTIRAHQYESISANNNIPRPLRAVGTIVNRKFQAGGGLSLDTGAEYLSFGGYYDKMVQSGDQDYKEGLILFVHAPKWLASVSANYLQTPGSTGALADATIRSATAAVAGIGYLANQPVDTFAIARPVWDKYARATYIHEILKNRQAMITCPVRFDIAPGSQIKVEITEDKFIKELFNPGSSLDCTDDALTFFWCSVMRVSTVIDCQNARAFTNYYVGYVRSEDENLDESTSTDRHPIWDSEDWSGCVMIEDPAFAPWTNV